MENNNSSQKIWVATFLTIIGFLSGLLSAIFTAGNFFNTSAVYGLLPGILFGIALSLYFIIFEQEKLSYKIIGFVAISTVAYDLAVLATIDTPLHVNASPFANPIDSTLFFSGGIVGALVLLIGIKFLLVPIKWSQLFLLTVLGGLLGTFGWMLGSFISPTIPTSSWVGAAGDLPKANMYSLYIVWQTAMAFAVSVCIKLNQKDVLIPAPNQVDESSKNQKNIFIGKIVSILGIILFLYSILSPIIERTYKNHQQAEVAKQYGPMPQENPVVVNIFSVDEMLVNSKVGDYSPGLANSYYDDKSSSPHWHQYEITYSKGENKGVDLSVDITQYATTEWAHFKLKDPLYTNSNYAVEFSARIHKINKFNNVVNSISHTDDSNIPWGGIYFWQSGDKVISVSFAGNEEDEFLKEYLTKYPSSL